MVKRISIYIDGANFYGGISSINPKYTDAKFDFERYIKYLVGENELTKIYYYNASLKQQINEELFKKQQRLFSRLRNIRKCKVIICKRKPRITEHGREYYTIKGDDINLAIDMLDDACENKYDKVILISSDGDFIPLVKRVKSKGKIVEVCYFKNCVSKELLRVVDEFKIIDKKILRKFFLRG